jgi:periplasmic protein CpxP/Spy
MTSFEAREEIYMNRFRYSLIAACVAAVLTAGAVHAVDSQSAAKSGHKYAHTRDHGYGDSSSMLMGMLKELELTDAQQQSIRAVIDGNAAQRDALRERQRANREALATTMPDNPDYPALIESQKQLAVDAIQRASETHTQIYNLLTAEQKARVPELIAQRKARWAERREMWRNRAETEKVQ